MGCELNIYDSGSSVVDFMAVFFAAMSITAKSCMTGGCHDYRTEQFTSEYIIHLSIL